MPRAKPTQVIEHRISLSNFERKEVKQLLDAQTLNNYVDLGIKGVVGVGAVGVGVGAVYVGYQGYLLAREIAAAAGEAASDAMKVVDDVSQSLSVERQQTYWSAFGDFFNPFISRVQFDLKHNNEEQFFARYGMSKAEYMATM